jgi:hypothetical protein
MPLFNTNMNDFNVSLNNANASTSQKNKFELTLRESIRLSDHEVALREAVIINSFPNITRAKGNNTFQYINWNNVTRTVDLLPTGVDAAIMSYDDMNGVLQQFMIRQNDYLIDPNGNPVYFLSIAVNTVYGRLQVVCGDVPTSLPAGYTAPTGVTLSGSSQRYQFVVTTSAFATLSGFSIGAHVPTNPPDMLSPNVPIITNTSSLIIKSNLVGDNDFSNISNELSSVVITAGSNEQLIHQPAYLNFRWIPQNEYTKITIEICDQNGNPITDLMDNSDNVFYLNIRKRK